MGTGRFKHTLGQHRVGRIIVNACARRLGSRAGQNRKGGKRVSQKKGRKGSEVKVGGGGGGGGWGGFEALPL